MQGQSPGTFEAQPSEIFWRWRRCNQCKGWPWKSILWNRWNCQETKIFNSNHQNDRSFPAKVPHYAGGWRWGCASNHAWIHRSIGRIYCDEFSKVEVVVGCRTQGKYQGMGWQDEREGLLNGKKGLHQAFDQRHEGGKSLFHKPIN